MTTPVGERLIPAVACHYPPAVDACDLILVDFDIQEVRHGALYLVEKEDGGNVTWRGCRRFDALPGRTLIDETGKGDWREFNARATGWRIAGEVKQVFKPSI